MRQKTKLSDEWITKDETSTLDCHPFFAIEIKKNSNDGLDKRCQ